MDDLTLNSIVFDAFERGRLPVFVTSLRNVTPFDHLLLVFIVSLENNKLIRCDSFKADVYVEDGMPAGSDDTDTWISV